MTPFLHAKCSVIRFGGTEDDYIAIHRLLDSTKLHLADARHRAVLHNTFGMDICEQIFGDYVINSDDNMIPVRDIAMHHIIEDIGFVPTLQEWLQDFKITKVWQGMAAPSKMIGPKLYKKEAYIEKKELNRLINTFDNGRTSKRSEHDRVVKPTR